MSVLQKNLRQRYQAYMDVKHQEKRVERKKKREDKTAVARGKVHLELQAKIKYYSK